MKKLLGAILALIALVFYALSILCNVPSVYAVEQSIDLPGVLCSSIFLVGYLGAVICLFELSGVRVFLFALSALSLLSAAGTLLFGFFESMHSLPDWLCGIIFFLQLFLTVPFYGFAEWVRPEGFGVFYYTIILLLLGLKIVLGIRIKRRRSRSLF